PTLIAHVAGGDAWDSGKTFFYDLTVDNLTNDSKKLFPGSSISLKFGHRGQWNAGVFFDNISYLQSTTFQTAYNGDGTLAIGTPGGIILTGLA
ncbi:MtrB/PioB family outer membrane beta-barrel protein, partial [Pseudomonas sp. GP01-A4]|uniref:MtrB/PioB family outer membrane beta-barrel protein n=1 Tax=Pseudomonas sp. GP01-A4 TaxID=2070571 RepID=UPI000CBB01A1